MWNSAYTYPRPASSTPAVMPSLVLSAPGSTGSTSGVSNAPMLSPSESLKSRASKLRKGHKSTTQDNEVDNNTTVVIHRHKHQHHHFHHHYLHINPSIPLLNALQAADIPMLQGIIMEHMITPRAVSIPLPLSYPGTHVSNPSSLRQFPAQSDVSLYSELVAPIAGPSDEDRGFKSGRKKALCIGINYVGQDRMLHGCINDARRVRKFLIEYHGYSSDNIIILTDAGNASGVPTRKNILKCMRWLVKGARRGDSLFFHYSGHGGQVRDIDGDEVDGLDEVIYPVDHRQSTYIVDDDMHEIMVKSLPAGCRLTAVFDSCHSGTALDLPYIYSSTGHLKNNRLSKRGAKRRSAADVISWAACEDGETTKDTFSIDGSAIGAMSHAFMNTLKQNPKLSYKDLLKYLTGQLQTRHNQKPQLSSSHRIDTNELFII